MTSLLLLMSLWMGAWSPIAQVPPTPPAPVTCPLSSPYVAPPSASSLTPTLEDGFEVVSSVLSSDGRVAVLVAKTDEHVTETLYRYEVVTGEVTEILNWEVLRGLRTEYFAGGVQVRDLTFIPDTHTVLFYTAIIPNVEGIYFEVPRDIWSLDVDSGTLTEVFPYNEGGKFGISPSGEHMVISTVNQIRLSAPDGSDVRTLYDGRVGLGGGEYIAWADIKWVSPDSFRIALLDAPLDAPDGGYAPHHPTRLVEFDLSGDSPLVTEYLSITDVIFFSVRLSPTGDALSYIRYHTTPDSPVRDLVVHPIGGEPIVMATSESVYGAEWLDAAHITWQELERTFIGDVCGLVTPAP